MKNLLELFSSSKYYEFELKNISLIEFLGDLRKEVSYSSLKSISDMFDRGYYFKKEYSENHFVIRGWTENKNFKIELKYENSKLRVNSTPIIVIYLVPIIFTFVIFTTVGAGWNFFFFVAIIVVTILGIQIGNKRALERFDKDLRIKLLENKIEYITD
jgi:hypothetical protein